MKQKNNKEMTIEKLAIMIGDGFNEVSERFDKVDQRFEEVDKRFEEVDKRFDEMDKRFDKVEKKVDNGFLNVYARLDIIDKDIKNFVTKDEFEDLMGRVQYIEAKLGIKSGK